MPAQSKVLDNLLSAVNQARVHESSCLGEIVVYKKYKGYSAVRAFDHAYRSRFYWAECLYWLATWSKS